MPDLVIILVFQKGSYACQNIMVVLNASLSQFANLTIMFATPYDM